MRKLVSRLITAVQIAFILAAARAVSGGNIVEDGEPKAQIVIAKNAIRPVTLAAEQLQEYVKKISGAELPINVEIDAAIPIKIYVGESEHTDRLGIDGDEFVYGGFRVKSGEDWLALVGRDRKFHPPKIWREKNGDSEKVNEEWDKATGEKFGYPYTQGYKEFNKKLGIHEKDERGSFNAVVHFLRSLGTRWYMPHELGEVVVKSETIALPEIDETVRPDFPVRMPLQWARRFTYDWTTPEEALWQWRMGWNQAPNVIGYGFGAHGINNVTKRDEVKEAHPEWYALYNGKRCTDFRHGGKPCLSSPELLEANVRYAKDLHDILGAPFLSVMPADAYTSLCQCQYCAGKSTPELGYRGLLSDYVWNYVNAVAGKLGEIRSDMRVGCGAYGTYRVPPASIDKFNSNVVVTLCQHRQDFHDAEKQKTTLEERKAFLEKLGDDGKIMINEKYRSGDHKPQYFPHIIAEDLKSLKGVSLGGRYEVFRINDKKRKNRGGVDHMASMHLNLYVTSRFWWDVDQDVDEMLDDYYEHFYGPAAAEMKAFVEYSEKNWAKAGKDPETIDQILTLIQKAADKVDSESVYGKRVALVQNFVKPLEDLKKKFELGRKNVPWAHVTPLKKKFKSPIIDGKLDEEVWSTWPTYKLKELETGREPVRGTTFKVIWDDRANALCFGIRCEEDDMENLNVPTKENENMLIFSGDAIEILLETLSHSYYQIAVNPSGAMTDIDRAKGIETLWASEAEVATHKGDGFWSVEIKIPVAGENQATILPLSGVAGSAPSVAYPWYFNLCRVRVRDGEKEASAFSPTGGKGGFHNIMKFGKLSFRPKPPKK